MRNWAHQQSIRGLGSAGGVAGERRWRSGGGAAAAIGIPARSGMEQINKMRYELQGVLEQGLGASIGSEIKRREELGKEVAMAAAAAMVAQNSAR
jgi:hypothetical protein